jgi:rare lipoprotein A (peptidoglycan hydrolase)
VRTLNWLLRAKASATVGLGPDYDGSTVSAVRAYQRAAGLSPDGVFAAPARRSLVGSLATNLASWYGAPLYGHQTACGLVLRRRTLGVANKTLPCGTRVVFGYRGNWVTTTVIDRGPYVDKREWDLTQATADRLDFTSAGVGSVKVAVVP